MDYLRHSVAAASAALGIGLLQYNLGTREFTTVLTAEQNLYTAQNNLEVAEGSVSIGLASVYRALGAVGKYAQTMSSSVRRAPRR